MGLLQLRRGTRCRVRWFEDIFSGLVRDEILIVVDVHPSGIRFRHPDDELVTTLGRGELLQVEVVS